MLSGQIACTAFDSSTSLHLFLYFLVGAELLFLNCSIISVLKVSINRDHIFSPSEI
jgi:hypothetical protein